MFSKFHDTRIQLLAMHLLIHKIVYGVDKTRHSNRIPFTTHLCSIQHTKRERWIGQREREKKNEIEAQ